MLFKKCSKAVSKSHFDKRYSYVGRIVIRNSTFNVILNRLIKGSLFETMCESTRD